MPSIAGACNFMDNAPLRFNYQPKQIDNSLYILYNTGRGRDNSNRRIANLEEEALH
eukprot:CAMPEP_0194316024 /NCGR_PEP_ID=MMETSP0171-20130528/12845_1 /TAXON_ID=218684 /ORGANISM="Corethron pennatum, Strain L29A3" /LENGTH=55 /DNA_ID=CAMNT_0039072105 /DNA_START=1 /DNA_END=168 /DNA_ORIENTATION=+